MAPSATKLRLERSADEIRLRAIPQRMIDAWNRGSGEDFAASFHENADFTAFDGTPLRGRAEIAAFHQRLFDHEMNGSRLEGSVRFVRLLAPDVAVLHAVAGTVQDGLHARRTGRYSLQLFVVRKHGDEWLVETLLHARRLTVNPQKLRDRMDEPEPPPAALGA